MNVIIFCSQESETQRLFRSVFSAGIDGTIEVYQTLDSFVKRLRRIEIDQTVHVIAVNGHKTLDSLLTEDLLIEDVKKIVVMLDNDRESMGKVHQLRPRYITTPHRGLKDLTAVLDKMIHRQS